MERKNLTLSEFKCDPFEILAKRWMLLCTGNFKVGKCNCMTVGWGALGTMWAKPFVMVVVRPQRYTFELMNDHSSFTLCALPASHQKALSLCGSKSGRELDKIKEAGLTPIASERINAPGLDEAELILECRKSYFDDIDPSHFHDPEIDNVYPNKDYHRMYFGEVLNIMAAPNSRYAPPA